MTRVACPRCHTPLQPAGQGLQCAHGHAFASWSGIPDLRTDGDPYLSTADDLAAASRIRGDGTRGWRDMLAAYYLENPKVPPAQAARFVHGTAAAEARASTVLETALGARSAQGTRWLDLGCGTAPLAIAAARVGADVVGLDAGMRWLAVAQARCREAGVTVPLVCANAQALPLDDGSFDVVAGESVLEHVLAQPAMLAEVRRVLRPGGTCFFTTPNRFFPGPDPHVGLLAGGFFSDAFVARYAQRRGMVPPRRHLLSVRALRRLFREAGFTKVSVSLPDVALSQLANASVGLRLGVAAYRALRRTPVLRAVLPWVAPTLLVMARCPDAPTVAPRP